jgi:hypothetical protein
MYPLANDENGHPIEVPAQAAGWLVRRHGGGKGRPAAAYDGDGRPLVVPLDATAADLRAAGLTPGMYRLDAVDGDRRSVNAIAYTEIGAGADGGAAGDLKPATPQDAVLLAMARTIDSFQRVQAERERQHAELMKHLIDRIGTGGGGGITWKDLDDYDRRKARAIEEEIARRNAAAPAVPDTASDDDAWWKPLMPLAPMLVNRLLAAFDMWMAPRAGKQTLPATPSATTAREAAPRVSAEPPSAPAAAPEEPSDAAAPTAESSESAEIPPEGAIEPPPEIKEKLDRVYARLTPEEQTLMNEGLVQVPEHLRAECLGTIILTPDDDAISYLRTQVFPHLRRRGKAS